MENNTSFLNSLVVTPAYNFVFINKKSQRKPVYHIKIFMVQAFDLYINLCPAIFCFALSKTGHTS